LAGNISCRRATSFDRLMTGTWSLIAVRSIFKKEKKKPEIITYWKA